MRPRAHHCCSLAVRVPTVFLRSFDVTRVSQRISGLVTQSLPLYGDHVMVEICPFTTTKKNLLNQDYNTLKLDLMNDSVVRQQIAIRQIFADMGPLRMKVFIDEMEVPLSSPDTKNVKSKETRYKKLHWRVVNYCSRQSTNLKLVKKFERTYASNTMRVFDKAHLNPFLNTFRRSSSVEFLDNILSLKGIWNLSQKLRIFCY